ncbi:MAG: DUF1853 family protein [Verrucomicrobiota bacterium]
MIFDEGRAEADLRWLLECPALLQSEETFALPNPLDSTFSWEPLERFLETKAAHRVGYYVEALLQCWLESREEISELQHGLQIRKEKETLGELDFLFRKEGRLHHLEVALKFYLHYPEGAPNGSRFIGPNARDSFERKRDRLLGKQLPFGRESFPAIEESSHFVKGMIFYHPDDAGEVELPSQLNREHARGCWIRERELDEYLASWPSHRSARILKKPYWLAAGKNGLSPDEVRRAADEHFRKWDGPVFLVEIEDEVEVERVFVMPERWPEEL